MNSLTKHITLGFSCQSSFTNYWTNSSFIRSPFDFNVVTKNFLLRSLEPNGSPFDLRLDDFVHFKSFDTGCDGVAANGIFFWHDFQRDDNFARDWRKDIPTVIERYKRRWQRFVEFCLDDRISKRFIVANTQHNLSEFCGENFTEAFGIDAAFLEQLIHKLLQFGVQNFTLDLTVKDIFDYLSILPVVKKHEDMCRARFCGSMGLPPNATIVAETAFDLLGFGDSFGDVSDLCGAYNSGMFIEKISSKSAIVSNHAGPIGEVRPFPNGFLFCFANGFDNFLRCTFDGNRVLFENRQVWLKLK